MNEWDDWSEDTKVEVLRRYLATFGEPAPIEGPRHYHPAEPDPDVDTVRCWDELAGAGHPRRSREFNQWKSAPKEQNELELERISLGLTCLVSYVNSGHGRYEANQQPFRRRWRMRGSRDREEGYDEI